MSDLIETWPELLTVERPARYLGGEMEALPNEIPDSRGRLMRVALAFADVYEIAHGHLGHKILYDMINGTPGLSAERAYAPWPDWEAVLRRRNRPLASLENRRPLAFFDIVGFSLQYELGYTNILNMLELGGIPARAAERGEDQPLLAAGGPGAANPEPLADFFDIFFLGDAERSFIEDLAIIKEWKYEKAPKKELFKRLQGRPGIYIPSFFSPVYDAEGRFNGLENLVSGYDRVVRAVATDLDAAPFPLCQISPLIKPVHDRVVVEIGRGCSRGCRFCQAGYIYRPVRERRRETVMRLAGENLKRSGQDEVSFLSLSAGDHTQIDSLVSGFMDEYAARTVALSLPSLRVKSLSGHLANQIKRVRKTGFTLAPEAGTQRLRDVINKDLTDDDLLAAAEMAFSLGWRTLKLYFMVGLPTETDDDLAGIAALTSRLRKMSRAQLNLGVAHFTPKAHTPFQWQPNASSAVISERLFKVRDFTKAPGLTPKWNAPGASWVESILARGNRRLGRVLELVHKAGARFEAWGDRFEPRYWEEALTAENMGGDFWHKPYTPDSTLPWDHLMAGPDKGYLKKELAKAEEGLTTQDCRFGPCLGCGACHDGASIDLAEVLPASSPAATGPTEPAETGSHPKLQAVFLINFQKAGRAAFLGHLELVALFKRAFRRAGIDLAMSEGFHPQPKMSFLTALPLGVVSEDEYLRVVTAEIMTPENLTRDLDASLPVDIILKGVTILPFHRSKIQPEAVTWKIESDRPVFTPGRPIYPGAVLEYTDKKKRKREHQLADFVTEAEAVSGRMAILTIKLGLAGTPKPIAAAAALWGLDPESFTAVLSKVKTILT